MLPVTQASAPAVMVKPQQVKAVPAKGDVAPSGCSVSTVAPGASVDIALDFSLSSDNSESSLPATPQPARSAAYGMPAGSYTRTGKKASNPDWQNQDASLVLPLGRSRTLLAVFDGHGRWGHLVAGRVREAVLAHALELVPQGPGPLAEDVARAVLKRLFALAEDALAREVDCTGRLLTEFSGTTATMALADAAAGRVAVAHVGDSALMLATGGQVFHRTVDHVVDAEAERRILLHGGEVQTFTISGISARRVCMRGSQFPGLAMSRALGDSVAHNLGVSSEPEVHTGIPFAAGSVLVVASDGVWEKMSMPEVARRVWGIRDPQSAARTIVEAARAQWPQEGNIDDITAVVLPAVPELPCAGTA